MRLTDNELRALCEQELTSSAAFSADLADERSKAMDLYLGEPLGNEQEGRSQIRTREVQDTVEWVLASLMRIFADADNICQFEAVGPEDEDAARQESDAISHVFWKDCRGFTNLYAFIKDGLLSKNGVLKIWWDETPDEEREEYENLNEWELAQLTQDPSRQTEVLDWSVNEDGTYNVTVLARRSNGRICIEPCPPEEFGVSRDARSIYPEDAPFNWHRTRKTKGELVEMGFDLKTVQELPSTNTDSLSQERLARRYLSDEQEDFDHADHWTLERVWLTECYIRVDRDDDGVPELVKVVLAGQDSNYASGSHLLGEPEVVDRVPFVSWSPVMRTHTFHGLSVADLVTDIQLTSTALTRSILDNVYFSNNGRIGINERVNIDDVLTSRPNGAVRVEGNDPPQNSIFPFQTQPPPPQAFEMFQRLDEMRQRRTGVGDDVGALDTSSLAQVNTGVAALAYDASRSKIEMMARLCAEVGLRPAFLRIHELLRKHAEGKQIALRTRNNWVQVRPQEWRERTDMTVMVGVGQVSRERRLLALDKVLERQAGIIANGGLGTLLLPHQIHGALADEADNLGVEAAKYYQDPRQLPPKQPEGPSVEQQALMAQAQAQLGAAEAQKQRNQVEFYKAQSQERVAMAKFQAEARAQESKRQIEQLEWQQQSAHRQLEVASAIEKERISMEIKERDQQIEMAQARMKDQQEAAKRETEMLRAIIQSGTSLTQEQMRIAGAAEGGAAGLFSDLQSQTAQMVQQAIAGVSEAVAREVGEVKAQLLEQREESRKPREIKRDANGLMIAIGDLPVERDGSGNVVRIG